MTHDPTERFSDRVAAYRHARPDYPPEALERIARVTGVASDAVVADVGSGTGILTRALLGLGYHVIGVEPNDAMRAAAEASIDHARFRSVAATAESTTLDDASVDLVTAGQAFHWFDVRRARSEWLRVLRRPAWVALLWNTRRRDGSAFDVAYEAFLHAWSIDYARVKAAWDVDDALRAFFGAAYETYEVDNPQVLDREGFSARVTSSSYMPPEGHPEHAPMVEALARIFDSHEREGSIDFGYVTKVYVGRLDVEG